MNKTFLFKPYQYPHPAALEQWLEQKASEGWYPDRLTHIHSMGMRLEKREPMQYKYIVDLQARCTAEYRRIYADLGWEYVGRMSSMHIWRQAYDDVPPASFTDMDSLNSRNRRFYIAISIVFWVMMLLVAVLAGVFLLERFGVLAIQDDPVDIWVDRIMPIVILGTVGTFIGLSARRVRHRK